MELYRTIILNTIMNLKSLSKTQNYSVSIRLMKDSTDIITSNSVGFVKEMTNYQYLTIN